MSDDVNAALGQLLAHWHPSEGERGPLRGEWPMAVLRSLVSGATVSEACQAAGVSRQAEFLLRQDDPIYDALRVLAMAAGSLPRQIARERRLLAQRSEARVRDRARAAMKKGKAA